MAEADPPHHREREQADAGERQRVHRQRIADRPEKLTEEEEEAKNHPGEGQKHRPQQRSPPYAEGVPADETPAVSKRGCQGEDGCRRLPRRKNFQHEKDSERHQTEAIQQDTVLRGEGIANAAFREKRRDPPPDSQHDGEDGEHAEIQTPIQPAGEAEQPGNKKQLTDDQQSQF